MKQTTTLSNEPGAVQREGLVCSQPVNPAPPDDRGETLDHRQIRLVGAMHCAQGDRPVEGGEATVIGYCQGEEVGIGHLTWPMDPCPVDHTKVENADGVWPKLMMFGACRLGQQADCHGDGHRAWIAGLADDSNESVLSQGAGCPPPLDLPLQPALG
jgi:hypothetical protein